MIRIVLADDHGVVREGLRALLTSRADCEVIGEASTGREAVRLCKSLEPDIAVLDIAMPELNGIEAAEQIHTCKASIGIIVLSMYSSSEHIYRAMKAGAAGYLLTESAATELIDAVREVRFGRRYISSSIEKKVTDGFLHPETSKHVRTPLERLSARERQVLQLVAEGRSSAEIASSLYLSAKTVDTYRSRLMKKLDLPDIAALVRFAVQHGIVSSS